MNKGDYIPALIRVNELAITKNCLYTVRQDYGILFMDLENERDFIVGFASSKPSLYDFFANKYADMIMNGITNFRHDQERYTLFGVKDEPNYRSITINTRAEYKELIAVASLLSVDKAVIHKMYYNIQYPSLVSKVDDYFKQGYQLTAKTAVGLARRIYDSPDALKSYYGKSVAKKVKSVNSYTYLLGDTVLFSCDDGRITVEDEGVSYIEVWYSSLFVPISGI